MMSAIVNLMERVRAAVDSRVDAMLAGWTSRA
jgi:hypothetical protein